MDFIYTLDSTAETPVIVLASHIGYDQDLGFGVDGTQFMREVMALDQMGAKTIEVWINSPGGSVMDGYNIYNALIKCKAKVNTYCYGMAASMAAIIFQAGKKRTIADIATFMIHNPYGSNDSEMLSAIREGLISAVASRSDKSKEEVGMMFDNTTWFTAEQCKADGLADEILMTGQVNKPKSAPTKETVSNILNEYQLIFNKIKPMQIDYTELKNALNLTEASKEAIVARFEALNKEIEDKTAELAEKVKELEDLKKSNEEAEVERAATELVENGIKAGKLKAEVKDAFIALAKVDFQTTKLAIDKMEVVKAAAIVPVVLNQTKQGIPADRQNWTIRDWEKQDEKGLAEIRNSNPELYTELYNSYYKK